LSGRIRPDGEALVTVVGRTGPEQVAIGHERPGTPFRYTANVHFDAHGGSGTRNERRACALTFTKTATAERSNLRRRPQSARQGERAMVRSRVLLCAAIAGLAVALAGCEPTPVYPTGGYVAPVYPAVSYGYGYGGPYYGGSYYGGGGYYGGGYTRYYGGGVYHGGVYRGGVYRRAGYGGGYYRGGGYHGGYRGGVRHAGGWRR
jgi:hypothetical protein